MWCRPGNPQALARACNEIFNLDIEKRCRLGQIARRRIECQFNISAIVDRYEALYLDLARLK